MFLIQFQTQNNAFFLRQESVSPKKYPWRVSFAHTAILAALARAWMATHRHSSAPIHYYIGGVRTGCQFVGWRSNLRAGQICGVKKETAWKCLPFCKKAVTLHRICANNNSFNQLTYYESIRNRFHFNSRFV